MRALLVALLAATSVLAWRAAWHPAMVGTAFAAGGVLVAAWGQRVFTAGQVLVIALLLRALFLALPPGVLSDDGARYVWDGVLQVEAGVSPFRHAPQADTLAAWHDAPMYKRLNSASYHSVYPPASQIVFAAGALAYEPAGWRGSFYVINALFALMEATLVWLLWRGGTHAGALLLYTLHPLVLLEAAGQGHTEAGAALGLVGAVLAARAGWGRLASAALAGATLFKLYPVVLFPFLWRRFRGDGLWPGALVGAFLSAPYALLLTGGVAWGEVWNTLGLYTQLFEFNAGPYYALKESARVFTGAGQSKTLGPLLKNAFLCGLPMLYLADAYQEWSLEKAFFWTLALFLLCATTVHPWYVLPLLALAAVRERPAWGWQWLALCAVGTYLFYAPLADAGRWYWAFVIMGWTGVAFGGLWRFRETLLRPILRRRAEGKARRVAGLLSADFFSKPRAPRVLDLGAGEGFVGQALRRQRGVEVVLADVCDFNRTALPHHVYDGRRLPFDDDAFDAVVLYFVLHHTADAEAVLREALRVAAQRVVVAESVYAGEGQRRLLRAVDRAANGLRGGAMAEGPLQFRRADAWRALIGQLGGRVVAEQRHGRWIHRQAFFAIDPPPNRLR